MQRIQIIDSHTEGEPTRVVVDGGPELGPLSAHERVRRLSESHDGFRAAVVREPRGADAMVGALLAAPVSEDAVAQVIFFNNVGYLGMCVHGTIGVARTLLHLGRISPGQHALETPAGEVRFSVGEQGRVEVENVFSYRHAQDVEVETASHGRVVGDVAYGGNWFFLLSTPGLEIAPENIEALTSLAWDVRQSLARQDICGPGGEEIDHIELFAPPSRPDADSKNFVLCPGKEYDRSPCGTGTSAKMACLAASGQLQEGQVWRQESTIGSLFEGRVRVADGGVFPSVAGHAYITSEATLLIEEHDPYPHGLGA